MKSALRRTLLAATALFCASTAAHAGPGANAGLNIRVTVPLVCQIDATDLTMSVNQTETSGVIQEMCNGAVSFSVVASHRALEDGEEVQLSYDGQYTRLDPAGVSAVASRTGPTFGNVPISIRSSGLVDDLAISLGLAVI